MATTKSEILLKRLQRFAFDCQQLAYNLPKTQYNLIYGNQLIRSSSSPGANYIEAIEALSCKDFIHRLRICRKECKEAIYWLELIEICNRSNKLISLKVKVLKNEATEFMKIFTSSIMTSEKKLK